MSNSTPVIKRYSYRYHFSLSFFLILAIPIICGVMMQKNASGYNALSPFISNPQDLIHSFSAWATEEGCYNCLEKKRAFFLWDFGFAIGLFLLNGVLMFGFWNKDQSIVKEEPIDAKHRKKARTIVFYLNKFTFSFSNFYRKTKLAKWKRYTIIAIIFFPLFFDILEGIFFLKGYDSSENLAKLVDVQNLKLGAYLVALAALLSKITYGFLEDHYPIESGFGKFLFRRIGYLFGNFYPALIGIFALAYLFSTFDAFDSLIIDMVQSLNFVAFVALFAGTLLTVWFIPYYLRFSKNFYGDLWNGKDRILKEILPQPVRSRGPSAPSISNLEKINEKESKRAAEIILEYFLGSIRAHLFAPIGKVSESESTNRLNLVNLDSEEFRSKLINGLLDEKKNPANGHYFHNLRRFIAYVFIMVLLSMEGKLLDNLLNTSHFHASIVGSSILLMLAYLAYYGHCILYDQKEVVDGKEKTPMHIGHLVLYRSILWLNVLFNVILVGYIILLLFFGLGSWFNLIKGLIIATYLLPFTFIGFSIYRRAAKQYVFVNNESKRARFFRSLYHKLGFKKSLVAYYNNAYDNWSFKSLKLIMPSFLYASVGIFLITFGFVLWDIPFFEWLNPLNLFLIFFNGVLTSIALLDRYFTLLKQKIAFKQLLDGKRDEDVGKKRLAVLTLIILYIGFLFISRATENYYHDVDYYAVSNESMKDSILTLERYTDNFLAKEKADTIKKPIIMIASDGGGLRAAYWTMLVLNYLDKETDGQFSNQVFLTTGVSGGGIGLSMYTHHLAEGVSPADRAENADKIGDTNFLSGDMSGIFGKGLVSQLLPPVKNLANWEDRSEAMARQYFELIEQVNYDTFKVKPFYEPWVKSNYDLPLLVVNTARTEDGSRGIVHPLKDNDPLNGFLNLNEDAEDRAISYPDATFLTNRFPIMSPAGRIEGKGHFVDGGYLENSGLSTIMYYLQKMTFSKDTIFKLFKDRKIIVLSISNDKSSYIQSQFPDSERQVNKSYSRGEISAIIGASTSTGTTALPKYYKKLFSNPAFSEIFGIKDFDFIQLPLPYRYSTDEVHEAFYGQITDCSIPDSVAQHNQRIIDHYSKNEDFMVDSLGKDVAIIMPPLGRLLPENTRDFMKVMLTYPAIKSRLDSVMVRL